MLAVKESRYKTDYGVQEMPRFNSKLLNIVTLKLWFLEDESYTVVGCCKYLSQSSTSMNTACDLHDAPLFSVSVY